MTEFSKARKGEHADVYVCPPGWDFGFVTDTEYFTDDFMDPITVKRQTWKLVDEVNVTFHPSTELCDECHGDEVVTIGTVQDSFGNWETEEVPCETCGGSGQHPLAGQATVEEIL